MPSAHRLSLPRSVLWIGFGVFVVLIVAAALGGRAMGERIVAARIRRAAAERGLVARWRDLRVTLPGHAMLRDLVMTDAADDTLVRAETLAVRIDTGSLLALHPQVSALELDHARIIKPP